MFGSFWGPNVAGINSVEGWQWAGGWDHSAVIKTTVPGCDSQVLVSATYQVCDIGRGTALVFSNVTRQVPILPALGDRILSKEVRELLHEKAG